MKQLIFAFMAILLNAGIVMAQEDGAVISIEETSYDFGQIKESDGNLTHVFTVENKGNQPLVITRVIPSCGCTSPSWTKEPIPPGQAGEVKVLFDPTGRSGPFTKTISVYSNGKRGSFVVTVKGDVQ